MKVVIEKLQIYIKSSLVKKSLIILQLVFGTAFIVVKLKLPSPPSTFPFYPQTALLLLLFYICLILSAYANSIGKSKGTFFRILIVIIVLSAGLTTFIYSSNPISKTLLEAESFTQTQRTAVATGNEAATSVKSGEITESEMIDRINQKYKDNPDAKQVAEEAFHTSISGNKTSEEVMREVFPTVPVRIGEWTCNNSGCSFADQNYVWTATNSNRAITSALIVFTITLLFWIANGEYITKLVRIEKDS